MFWDERRTVIYTTTEGPHGFWGSMWSIVVLDIGFSIGCIIGIIRDPLIGSCSVPPNEVLVGQHQLCAMFRHSTCPTYKLLALLGDEGSKGHRYERSKDANRWDPPSSPDLAGPARRRRDGGWDLLGTDRGRAALWQRQNRMNCTPFWTGKTWKNQKPGEPREPEKRQLSS